MAALYPDSTQFAVFPSEEGHSIIGTYEKDNVVRHFHLITFQDLDSVAAFGKMVLDYYEAHKTPIPPVYTKALNND